MFHLGDDCRKMTPSTYRKNTTFTIPLLRILRVLSHSSIYYRWEYWISCRIFFTYQRLLSACAWFNMCLHQRAHPNLSCYIYFFPDWCSFRKGHLRYLSCSICSPTSQESCGEKLHSMSGPGIHSACWHGTVEVVKLLLDFNANLEVPADWSNCGLFFLQGTICRQLFGWYNLIGFLSLFLFFINLYLITRYAKSSPWNFTCLVVRSSFGSKAW